jgi:hypothetical protein
MGIRRSTHLLKALVIAGIAAASLAGTSVVAHAYPPPKETHSIHCSPGSVSASGGTCTAAFTDKAKGEGAGQKVCFDVTGPLTPKHICSTTNVNGQATAIFTANSSACGREDSSKEDSGTKATITGTEQVAGRTATTEEAGTAQTTVKIRCPDEDRDAVSGSPQHPGSGSTTAIATSARSTGASVAPLTAGQVVPAAAILAVIVVLSAAITGRLRLRRLRR